MSTIRRLSAVGAAVVLGLGSTAAAASAVRPTAAATAASATPGSQTFDAPGGHAFVVPARVTSLTVDAYGAQGGNSNGGPPNPAGGLGGRTTATIAVTPGETLQVNVGGRGGNGSEGAGTAGVNGGGAGASSGGIAGGGGGGSDLRRGGTGLDDRVVVAGGGGGAGAFVIGGAGGVGGGDVPTAGTDGGFDPFSFQIGRGGAAGGADAGGAGGAGQVQGADGAAGQGGAGALGLDDGGGGGGGWYGGGGGGAGEAGGGGGGGGSGYVVDGATGVSFGNGVRAGDGLVELSWVQAPEVRLPSGRYDRVEVRGSTIIVRGRASDPDGTPVIRVTSTRNGRVYRFERRSTPPTFATSFTGATGTHRVCVDVLDNPTRQVTSLGCRSATVK